MLVFKEISPNNFPFFIQLVIRQYADDLFDYGEATDKDRARQFSEKEINRIIPQGFKMPNHYIYRVKDKDKTVGWLWYEMMPEEGSAFLMYILVEKKYRGKGYGQEMMHLFEAAAKERGAKVINFFVFKKNPPAVHVYQKLGYQIIEEKAFYDAVAPTRYKMRKAIA